MYEYIKEYTGNNITVVFNECVIEYKIFITPSFEKIVFVGDLLDDRCFRIRFIFNDKISFDVLRKIKLSDFVCDNVIVIIDTRSIEDTSVNLCSPMMFICHMINFMKENSRSLVSLSWVAGNVIENEWESLGYDEILEYLEKKIYIIRSINESAYWKIEENSRTEALLKRFIVFYGINIREYDLFNTNHMRSLYDELQKLNSSDYSIRSTKLNHIIQKYLDNSIEQIIKKKPPSASFIGKYLIDIEFSALPFITHELGDEFLLINPNSIHLQKFIGNYMALKENSNHGQTQGNGEYNKIEQEERRFIKYMLFNTMFYSHHNYMSRNKYLDNFLEEYYNTVIIGNNIDVSVLLTHNIFNKSYKIDLSKIKEDWEITQLHLIVKENYDTEIFVSICMINLEYFHKYFSSGYLCYKDAFLLLKDKLRTQLSSIKNNKRKPKMYKKWSRFVEFIESSDKETEEGDLKEFFERINDNWFKFNWRYHRFRIVVLIVIVVVLSLLLLVKFKRNKARIK